MTFDDVWPMEQSLWLGGPDEYEAMLHPNCLMAFAQVGVLDADAVKESVRGQRWGSVSPTGTMNSAVDGGLIVIGYRAEAQRDGSPLYRCVCTTTYARVGDGWQVLQHQQSVES